MKIRSLKDAVDPPEPELPADVAEFIKTEFGQKVHDYYMAELEYIMCQGYKEARDMVEEERKIADDLRRQLQEFKDER